MEENSYKILIVNYITKFYFGSWKICCDIM